MFMYNSYVALVFHTKTVITFRNNEIRNYNRLGYKRLCCCFYTTNTAYIHISIITHILCIYLYWIRLYWLLVSGSSSMLVCIIVRKGMSTSLQIGKEKKTPRVYFGKRKLMKKCKLHTNLVPLVLHFVLVYFCIAQTNREKTTSVSRQ